jgi:Flp pilus assembly protein TadD
LGAAYALAGRAAEAIPLLAHCRLGLGKLYLESGRPEEARAELLTAIELYCTMDMAFWQSQAETALAQTK